MIEFEQIEKEWEELGCTRGCWAVFHMTQGRHKTNCPLAHIQTTTRSYCWESLPDLSEHCEYAVKEIVPSENFKGTVRVEFTYIPSEGEIS